MIANLMTTLLLALSVATNNVSINDYKSGNAFNHELTENDKKPKIKNAQYTYDEDITFEQQSHVYQYSQQPYTLYDYYKYYLKDLDREQQTSVKVMPNMMITNTIYTLEYWQGENPNTQHRMMDQFAILKIKNIYNGVNTFTLDLHASARQDGTTFEHESYSWKSTDENINQLIDMTLTSNFLANFYSVFDNVQKELIASNVDYPPLNVNTYNVNTQTPQITLEEDQEIYLILLNRCSKYYQPIQTDIIPVYQNLNIVASYIAPENTTEIIDIPNLMYTILTMPFAFYSTAFNLTIFPNTPYSINFGNLILTILGALILFYLIKKVIK